MSTQRTVVAPHKVDKNDGHYAAVIAEMETRGAPTLRGCLDGDYVLLVEGSHRLAAAEELGLVPEIVIVDQESVDHDCDDMPNPCSARDLADYYGSAHERSRDGAAIMHVRIDE